MSSVRRVLAADDPRLRDYTGLTDVELRTHAASPPRACSSPRARRSSGGPSTPVTRCARCCSSAKWVDVMRDVIDDRPRPGLRRPTRELAEQVTGYHVHRGALASMQRKPLPDGARAAAAAARRVVVMEAVNDHTNIGAIFRCAAALGMDAVLLSPDCADPLYRRSVKVSMGAVFSVPYARLDAWPSGLDRSASRASPCSPSPRTRRRHPSTRPPRTRPTGSP